MACMPREGKRAEVVLTTDGSDAGGHDTGIERVRNVPAAKGLPRRECGAKRQTVTVALGERGAAGVESCGDHPNTQHPDLVREARVVVACHAGRRTGEGRIEVGHLAGGMAPRVGAPGPYHPDRAPVHRLQRPLENALYGAPAGLTLPAGKGAPEIGQTHRET